MSTAIQKQPQQQPDALLQQFLKVRQTHLADVLPKSKALTPEKVIKLALLAAKKQPALLKCDMNSVFSALLQCAELGLEPSGTLGSAYLVPYGSTCTLVIGYRGLIDLARRSGSLRQIEAHVVHERDAFRVRFGLEPVLEHEPFLDGDPGKPKLVYVVAQLEDGARHVEVMTIAEVDRIRDRSKSGKNGPWVSDYEEMAKKTVARRACKWLPLSADLAHGMAIEDGETIEGTVSGGSDVSVALAPAPPAQTQTANVKQALKAKRSVIVDVKAGESEEQALARAKAEEPERDPNTNEIIPPLPGDEPPPPTDADFVPVAAREQTP